MRRKPSILPCVIAMREAGIEYLLDACLLVHLGRCGPQGSTKPLAASALGVSYDIARASMDRLEALELVTPYTRQATTGRADVFAVSASGWKLLTTPAVMPEYSHEGKGDA